jgi:glycosyltransferase involved in cell wall biosynthesis
VPRVEYEIILVDDCSTDNSASIYENFSSDIQITRLAKNVGLASAANIGLRKSRGRYTVRVDADDFVHTDFVRSAVGYMDMMSADVDAVSIDYERVDEHGKHLSFESSMTNQIACGLVFKFEILIDLGFYKEGLRYNEDIELITRFREKGYRLGNLSFPLYKYVQRSNSLSRYILK